MYLKSAGRCRSGPHWRSTRRSLARVLETRDASRSPGDSQGLRSPPSGEWVTRLMLWAPAISSPERCRQSWAGLLAGAPPWLICQFGKKAGQVQPAKNTVPEPLVPLKVPPRRKCSRLCSPPPVAWPGRSPLAGSGSTRQRRAEHAGTRAFPGGGGPLIAAGGGRVRRHGGSSGPEHAGQELDHCASRPGEVQAVAVENSVIP